MSKLYYIDLTPDKCIGIRERHILIKFGGSYHQGRPTNPTENKLLDEIVMLRDHLAGCRDNIAEARHLVGAVDDETLGDAIQRRMNGLQS